MIFEQRLLLSDIRHRTVIARPKAAIRGEEGLRRHL